MDVRLSVEIVVSCEVGNIDHAVGIVVSEQGATNGCVHVVDFDAGRHFRDRVLANEESSCAVVEANAETLLTDLGAERDVQVAVAIDVDGLKPVRPVVRSQPYIRALS